MAYLIAPFRALLSETASDQSLLTADYESALLKSYWTEAKVYVMQLSDWMSVLLLINT